MKFRFPNTLSFRLAASIVIIFLSFLLLTFYITFVIIDIRIKSEIDNDLVEDIYFYKNTLNQDSFGNTIEVIGQDMQSNLSGDEFIRILGSSGELIYTSEQTSHLKLDNYTNDILNKMNVIPDQQLIYFNTIQLLPNQENEFRIATAQFTPDTFIQIGESLHNLAEVKELLTHSFTIILITMLIPVLFLSWFIANHTTKGIREVSNAANEIKSGNLNFRVIVKDQSDEIQNLSTTFNSMADRIRELMKEMREMIDNIAHDLKSPLTRIRMIAEATITDTNNDYKTTAEDTLEQCDKLLQYINATLDVAEADAGIGINQTNKVDITEITNDACELFQTLADEKNIKMDTDIQPECLAYGNNQSIQRMIANIIDNAIKYSPADTKIIIKLVKDNNDIHLTVSDSGPGISSNELGRVFNRFYRCDNSRTKEGSGLGLSYARAVARSHGGEITLDSIVGQGSTFTINLPAC